MKKQAQRINHKISTSNALHVYHHENTKNASEKIHSELPSETTQNHHPASAPLDASNAGNANSSDEHQAPLRRDVETEDPNGVSRADIELIHSGLAGLSPDHRQVIELTYFCGYSYQEIAEIADCPVNTVKTRMFHARRRLKVLLPRLAGERPEQQREQK